ncbi:MAG: hypothetical protein ACOC9T_03430, partial [Myxococcota bacterium]
MLGSLAAFQGVTRWRWGPWAPPAETQTISERQRLVQYERRRTEALEKQVEATERSARAATTAITFAVPAAITFAVP